MGKKLQQIQAKARELALSGTFIGWRPIAFTLQFEEGFAEAFDWISATPLDRASNGINAIRTDLRLVTKVTQWHYFSLGPAGQLDFALPRPTSQLYRTFAWKKHETARTCCFRAAGITITRT